MRHIIVIMFLLTAALSLTASAQTPPPPKMLQVSPAATVTQTIGLTDITITYHRPGVKGREIWGKLVPYNQVWRAGANNATTISFSDDVTIGGKTLKAGMYSFFTLPTQTDWTVIFNSVADQWGAYSYDSTKDVLRFSVKPEPAPSEEWLSYSFSDLTVSSVKVTLSWEKLAIPFIVSTNTDENFTRQMKAAASQASAYARYSLDTKTNWDGGMEAVSKAIALNPSFGAYALKANLLAQKERWTDAVKAGEDALKIGKDQKANTGALEKSLAEWKDKAKSSGNK
jgi:hypothetical protein